MPGAAHGVADQQPFGERAVIVACSARRSRRPRRRGAPAAPLVADMAGEHAAVGEFGEGNALGQIGTAGLGVVSHFRPPLSAVECGHHGKPRSAMSTSPALVCLGEPLIEFNRPQAKATAAPGCRASAAIRRTSRSPPPARARRPAISPASARTGWATPSSSCGSPKASMPRASAAIPRAPTGVSFVTHGAGRPQVRLPAQEFRGFADDAGRLAGGLHRRRPRSSISRPSARRSATAPAQTCDAAIDGRARRRREGLLRHQPAPAAVGPRHGARGRSMPPSRAATSPCRASTIPSSSPASTSPTPSPTTTSSSARRWSR